MGFEVLARGIYLEALLIEGDAIYYSDVVAGGIHRADSDAVLLEGRRMVGGLLMNVDGSLLVSGEGGIVWVDPSRGASGTLLDGLDGVNELRADGRGGLYFGTIDIPALGRGDPSQGSSLYHLAADRTLTRLAEGLVFSNGLSPSAEGDLLFHNESFVGTFAYPVVEDGQLGERKRLLRKRDCDGLALDGEGNLWLSGFDSGDLVCLTPDGTEVRRVPLPGGACTNVRFGGPDQRELYVTTVPFEAVAALGRGAMPSEANSLLLKGRSPTRGAPLGRTDFDLG